MKTQKKDWLGRERLSDRMTGTSNDQVNAAVGAAILSWDEGRQAHVCIVRTLAAVDSDGLTEVLDGILEVGWVLQSTALGNTTVGPNMQHAMFVFIRPVPGL